jgi:hypothetical protein
MSFNETAITNGVSISGSTSPFNTYIKTENLGVYNIQFSAQVDKTDGGTDEIDIWIRKNGTDLIDTSTKLTLAGNSTKVVAAWNWFVQSTANDYYQIIWRSADTSMRLFAEASSSQHPGIPSVILTANRVDQFLSNTGSFTGSFEGDGSKLTGIVGGESVYKYTGSAGTSIVPVTGSNNATGSFNVVGGGQSNIITIGNYTTIGGGFSNTACLGATVGGGCRNIASGVSTIGGGIDNRILGGWSTIGGGNSNCQIAMSHRRREKFDISTYNNSPCSFINNYFGYTAV